MKVLRKKILVLVIGSILSSAVLVMILAFFNYGKILDDNSGQIMQLTCSEKRLIMDEKLLNIEKSVNMIYHFAVDQIFETDNVLQDEKLFSEHINRMNALMKTTGKYTDGAVSVYYRVIAGDKGNALGAWLVQNANGEFVNKEITDISMYDKDDIEHVGWYYIPIANRKETWLNPYYNKNMEEEIISYVIPIIIDDDVKGIVGMDISTDLLFDNAKSVKVFDSGYAFLMDDEGSFVYHPEMKDKNITSEFDDQHAFLYETGMLSATEQSVEHYKWNDEKKRMIAQKLRNGMIFAVCVDEQEIVRPQSKMMQKSLLIASLLVFLFVAITVSIINFIVKLTYSDSTTRLGNKTAYTEFIDELNKKISNKKISDFTVFVIDINDLKKINDTYGHEYGDMLIQNGANILRKVWRSSCIYRTGGDEFVIIYPEKVDINKKMALFEKAIYEYNNHNEVKELFLQIAIGAEVFVPETDTEYIDVFRKADAAMYIDKKKKKRGYQ